MGRKFDEWLIEHEWALSIHNKLIGGPSWFFRTRGVSLYCWLVGHVRVSGEKISAGWSTYTLTPDYCGRCLLNWEDDKIDLENEHTLPARLRHALVWGIEHSKLIGWFFDWTMKNKWMYRHLPKWWEY